MGFSEDDRIRSKNKIQNEAYKIYEDLKAFGYDNDYIIKYAQFALTTSNDNFRNDVLNKIIDLARSLNEGNSN